uniref:Uncharacterized protein n=1 Tax=Oryza sativa subsp. japonica TaxID=39947 RepID=Q6K9N4_ORYSJ|nr:hypothetical protein [Oryza sativa Japonica Group]
MRRSIQRWRLPPPPLAFLRRRWQRRRQPRADPAAAGGSNGGGSLLRRLSSPSGGGGGGCDGRGLIAWRRLRAAVATAEVGSAPPLQRREERWPPRGALPPRGVGLDIPGTDLQSD